MPEQPSSYLEGIRAGEGIGGDLTGPALEAIAYRKRLAAAAAQHAEAMGLKREEMGAREAYQEAGLGQRERELSEKQRHDKAMEDIAKGKGPGKSSAAQVPPEVKVAIANRDNVRKQITALNASGLGADATLQAKLDQAEGNLRRVAASNKFDLGEDSASTQEFERIQKALKDKAAADLATKHPVRTWLQKKTGMFGYPGAAEAPVTGQEDWRMFDK